jgi:hypothetical protein
VRKISDRSSEFNLVYENDPKKIQFTERYTCGDADSEEININKSPTRRSTLAQKQQQLKMQHVPKTKRHVPVRACVSARATFSNQSLS